MQPARDQEGIKETCSQLGTQRGLKRKDSQLGTQRGLKRKDSQLGTETEDQIADRLMFNYNDIPTLYTHISDLLILYIFSSWL